MRASRIGENISQPIDPTIELLIRRQEAQAQALAGVYDLLRARPRQVTEAAGELPQILTHLNLKIADLETTNKLLKDLIEKVIEEHRENTAIVLDTVSGYKEHVDQAFKSIKDRFDKLS